MKEGAEGEKETLKRENVAEKSPSRLEEGTARAEDKVSGSSGPWSPGSGPQVSGSQVSRVRVPDEGNVGSDHVGSSAQKVSGTEAKKRYADTDVGGKADAKQPDANAYAKSAGAKFVGSSTSKKYHRLDCRYALKIKADKRVYFSGEEDAKSQGYLPCKVCNP